MIRRLALTVSFVCAFSPISGLSHPDPICLQHPPDTPDVCGSLRAPAANVAEAEQLAANIHDAESAETFIHFILMNWDPIYDSLPVIAEENPPLDGAGARDWEPATTRDGRTFYLRAVSRHDPIWPDLYWGWKAMLSLTWYQQDLIKYSAADTYEVWAAMSGGLL